MWMVNIRRLSNEGYLMTCSLACSHHPLNFALDVLSHVHIYLSNLAPALNKQDLVMGKKHVLN